MVRVRRGLGSRTYDEKAHVRTWLTRNPKGSQQNVAWVEMPNGRMMLLTEDGKIEVASEYDSRIVKRLLAENVTWELIR